MAASITFLHLSDLHVGDAATPEAALLSDTRATLDEVLRMIEAIEPRPSFVAISGDLTDRGDPASYRIVRDACARLSCPVVYGLGNHDSRDGYAEVMGSTESDATRDVRHRLIDGLHVVAIDTNVPGRIGGAIGARQFDRLDAVLAHHPEHPKVIVMHHPPALARDGEMAWQALAAADTARLAGLLRGRTVATILTGHIHLDRVVLWHGIPVVTVSGQHAAGDPLHRGGLRSLRGASFALCRLAPPEFDVTFVQMPADRAELERLPQSLIDTFV